MKKLFTCIVLFLFYYSTLYSQEIKTVGFFSILLANLNGEDRSEVYQDENAVLTFMQKDGKIVMSNVWLESKSNSSGLFFDYQSKLHTDAKSGLKSLVVLGNWHYQNSYDDKKGFASITIIINELADNKPIYELIQVTQELDYTIYKGEVLGDFNWKLFDDK